MEATSTCALDIYTAYASIRIYIYIYLDTCTPVDTERVFYVPGHTDEESSEEGSERKRTKGGRRKERNKADDLAQNQEDRATTQQLPLSLSLSPSSTSFLIFSPPLPLSSRENACTHAPRRPHASVGIDVQI